MLHSQHNQQPPKTKIHPTTMNRCRADRFTICIKQSLSRVKPQFKQDQSPHRHTTIFFLSADVSFVSI